MPHEVPTAAVVVPLMVVELVAVLWWLRRRDALNPLRVLAGLVACVYAAGIIANTVLPIYTSGISRGDQSWTVYLALTPLTDYEPADFVQNVIVFLPMGILLPLVFRVDSVLRVLGWGFVTSIVMEAVQLVNAVIGYGGHVADINDLLANTVGAPLGYGLYRALLLVPVLARLDAAATWPAPADGPLDVTARSAPRRGE